MKGTALATAPSCHSLDVDSVDLFNRHNNAHAVRATRRVNSVNRNGSLAAAATHSLMTTGGRTWLELAYRWSVGLYDIFPELNRSTTRHLALF
jgi:hypothetical protein